MKIIFFGTPYFSAYILDEIKNNYEVLVVITKPDQRTGRGQKKTSALVKQSAVKNNIPVLEPKDLNNLDFINLLKEYNADLFVVVAFAKLPERVWNIPKYGSINLHTSLLPDYRGAAPINWVLINGECTTGITTFFINNRIDKGDIILQEKINIKEDTTVANLYKNMMGKSAVLLDRSIQLIEKSQIAPVTQCVDKIYKKAPKIRKDMYKIDWKKDAKDIHNLIRGLSPYINDDSYIKDVSICPGAWFFLISHNTKIRVKIMLSSFNNYKTTVPGSIITDNKTFLNITANDGCISILKLQPEGKKKMDVKDFLLGNKISDNATAS